MLRLALMGYDDQANSLAQAAVESQRFELAAVCQFPPDERFASAPHRRVESEWEWLLHDDSIDAVIVGREGIDQREDALRKLAQAGKPLLLTFPPCDPIFAFELEMNRQEGGRPILLYIPHMAHRLTERFLAQRESLGAVELVTIERRLADCSSAAVRGAFAADVPLLRHMLGGIAQVSAVGDSSESGRQANLSIAVQNEQGGVGRWSVEPAADQSTVIAARGAQGRTQLTMTAASGEWSLELPSGEIVSAAEPATAETLAADGLEQLDRALGGTERDGSWDQVCRDLEVADLVDLSLRRGRTMELHGDEVSERGTFKGIMSAGGCFLLMFSLLVLLVVSLVEGIQAPFRDHVLWRLWPVFLLAPIVVFLALQLLQLAIKRPAMRSRERPP